MGQVGMPLVKDFYASGEDISDEKLTNNIIDKEIIFKGKIFDIEKNLVQLPNKEETIREIVKQPNAVGIFAMTKDNKIVLIRQYRTSVDRVVIEIPAGKVDDGETPIQAARREFLEETGYQAEHMQYLTTIASSIGFTGEHIDIFYADGLEFVGSNPNNSEFIDINLIPYHQIKTAIKEHKIIDGKTIVAFLYFNSFCA